MRTIKKIKKNNEW